MSHPVGSACWLVLVSGGGSPLRCQACWGLGRGQWPRPLCFRSPVAGPRVVHEQRHIPPCSAKGGAFRLTIQVPVGWICLRLCCLLLYLSLARNTSKEEKPFLDFQHGTMLVLLFRCPPGDSSKFSLQLQPLGTAHPDLNRSPFVGTIGSWVHQRFPVPFSVSRFGRQWLSVLFCGHSSLWLGSTPGRGGVQLYFSCALLYGE